MLSWRNAEARYNWINRDYQARLDWLLKQVSSEAQSPPSSTARTGKDALDDQKSGPTLEGEGR